NPMDIFNSDSDVRRVLMQLVNGFYSPDNTELFRDIYNSLLNTQCTQYADTYFNLKDFRSYCEAQEKIQEAYKDEARWAKMAMLNVANVGKFSSDRTIEEYVKDIWKINKIEL
ncbi:MAG: glycogen/starch/alpha-glucan phosphorylase, partial [Lachnospiraceae bacterium]|nr:glycogen/starch/alpha-glucan phosphorylase [Lachnospiraceae bacterium]